MAKTKKAKKAPNPKFRAAQFIVGKLVKKESIDWAREIKIAQRLLTKFPDVKFWEWLNLGFQLNSLAWFISPDGTKRLKKEFGQFNLVLPEPPKYVMDLVNPVEIQAPSVETIRGTTIKDFLK